MNLRAFLNAGFALLVEAYTSLGVNIVEATDRAWEALGVDSSEEQKEASIEGGNDAALAQLQSMMQGVA